METKIKKHVKITDLEGLGTPNQKAAYARVGIMLEIEQNQPYYRGQAFAIAKLAGTMTTMYITELQRWKIAKELGTVEKIREVENLPSGEEQKQLV